MRQKISFVLFRRRAVNDAIVQTSTDGQTDRRIISAGSDSIGHLTSLLRCLENGVLLCQHANNVNDAARKAYSLKVVLPPPNFYLEDCKYRYDARPQTFNARDNVSQFIKWARRVVGVREVLMFESDDLILRKNEKNFLLCLLEIARFGSKFGVSVPAIIQLEDEIEREIQRDKQSEIMSFTELRRQQREEEKQLKTHSASHGKYSKLLKLVRHEHQHETSRNIYNTFSLSHSNGANWLRQRISRIPKLTQSDRKKRSSGEESNETSSSTEMTMTNNVGKKKEPESSRTLSEFETKVEMPTSSSQLHKTVITLRRALSHSSASFLLLLGRSNDGYVLLCPTLSRRSTRRRKVSHRRKWNDHFHSSESTNRKIISVAERVFSLLSRFFVTMLWYVSAAVGIPWRII